MVRRIAIVCLLVIAGIAADTVRAEEFHYFPRLRQMQDLVSRTQGSRYRDRSGLLGQEAFTAGFSAGYLSDYYWRGFNLFDSSSLFRGDAYVNVFGFEASVWGMWDAARENLRPVEVDYRFRYKFELEGAQMSFGYTFYDFSGSDGGLGKRSQGFGKQPFKELNGGRFPPGIHELHFHLTYFTSLLQEEGANLRYTINYWQRVDEEGSRIESTVSMFVNSPNFTIFGDYFEISTTTIYQHRYLTDRSSFQGQLNSAKMVYNLEKYRLFPMFIVLEFNYYVGFHKDLVDGFYFGGSVNFRF